MAIEHALEWGPTMRLMKQTRLEGPGGYFEWLKPTIPDAGNIED
jgi:hypothetical protein